MSVQPVGGQAVIEGVMMKAKTRLSVAVRLPSGKIALKTTACGSLSQKWPFLGWPFLRGPLVLMETMVYGLKALSFSASQIMEDEGEKISSASLALTMLGAFIAAMTLFVALPHLLTWILGTFTPLNFDVRSLSFHIIDGILKVLIFMIYIWAISFMKQIERVFAYHGAEHKSIHCLEAGKELTVINAQSCSRLHNRCGTTFLLLVLTVSIAAFAVIFPFLPSLSANQFLNQALQITLKIFCMFPLAGIAYEIIRLAGKRQNNTLCRMLLWPGLQMQKLTTREPDEAQLETAIVALKAALATSEIPADVEIMDSAVMDQTIPPRREAMAL
ncbi:MAG: DUF1385 domain-containing protein [Desulfarculales bacterium]|jgi:uncharacterized protein YqhQ|nr:DUF1385 domain-containing protein [Desulfarculales bacterium]